MAASSASLFSPAVVAMLAIATALAVAWATFFTQRARSGTWAVFLGACFFTLLAGVGIGMVRYVQGMNDIVRLGPAVTPADLAETVRHALLPAAIGTMASVCGFTGGLIGLATRSRPPEPTAARGRLATP